MQTLYLNLMPLVPGQGYPISLTEQLGAEGAATDFLPESLAFPARAPVAAGRLDTEAIAKAVSQTTGSSEIFKKTGSELFRFLTQTRTGQDWHGRVRSDPLRTILNIRDLTLRSLPWELMLDEYQWPLFADHERPLIHRSFAPRPDGVRPQKWPLRILVVVGSAPTDSVLAEEEVHGVEKALLEFGRLVELNVLRQPTLSNFEHEFTCTFRPHVFHFIGHGADANGGTRLRFHQTSGPDGQLDVPGIHTLLLKWAPRLVFLNACRTGDLPAVQQSPALSDAFATRVPAVIGMRGKVRGEVAAKFSAGFYAAFAKEKTVDVAMAKARGAVAAESDRVDWCLPRLSLSDLPEEVLKMEPPLPEVERLKIEKFEEFKPLRLFVNRSSERRQLCNGLDPIEQEEHYRDFTVISGTSAVGKSALLHYALEGCLLRGWKVAYARMDDGTTRDFLDTLRLIRGGSNKALGLARSTLDQNVFSTFNHQLNNLEDLARNALPPPEPGKVIKEHQPGAKIPPALISDVAPQLAESFARALQEAAGGRPLVIALDQVNFSLSEFENFLLPHFFKRLAQRDWEPLRLLLVLSEDQKKIYKMDGFVADPIDLKAFQPEEFPILAEDYCRRAGPITDDLRKILDGTAGRLRAKKEAWTPGKWFEILNVYLYS